MAGSRYKTNCDLRRQYRIILAALGENMYALLTKREVKMAGYWPSSFLRFYGPRRSRGP